MITLASASLGLVAALAWNEAIKAIIKEVLQTGVCELRVSTGVWCTRRSGFFGQETRVCANHKPSGAMPVFAAGDNPMRAGGSSS